MSEETKNQQAGHELGTRFQKLGLAQLAKIAQTGKNTVAQVADAGFTCLQSGGVLHTFGTGHSVVGAMELYHRAGGLVPVNAILETEFSPFVPPSEAQKAERHAEVGKQLVTRYDLRSGELILIFSQSGINSAPIDVALAAKEAGLRIVAITSCAHSLSMETRHSSGKRLMEVADFVIDNCAPVGDASLGVEPHGRIGPTSTLAAVFIANWVVAEIVSRYQANEMEPPVYQSANTVGGDEHNHRLEKQYASRIKGLLEVEEN